MKLKASFRQVKGFWGNSSNTSVLFPISCNSRKMYKVFWYHFQYNKSLKKFTEVTEWVSQCIPGLRYNAGVPEISMKPVKTTMQSWGGVGRGSWRRSAISLWIKIWVISSYFSLNSDVCAHRGAHMSVYTLLLSLHYSFCKWTQNCSNRKEKYNFSSCFLKTHFN